METQVKTIVEYRKKCTDLHEISKKYQPDMSCGYCSDRGWYTSHMCENCGNTEIIGVEYQWPHPEEYDGISEYWCKPCGLRVGRWSGNILATGESERRYGRPFKKTRNYGNNN